MDMMSAADIVSNAGVGTLACTKSGGIFGLLCGWQMAAGSALVASAVLLAFIYMLSVLLRNDNLKNFVRFEMNEMFVTAALVVVVLMAVSMVSGLSFVSLFKPQYVPRGVAASANIYNITETYFVRVESDMSAWLEMNYILSVYMDSLASATPYPRPMGVGLVASPFAGLASPFKQLLYNMSTALAVAYIINYAQLYVYLFALAGSLHYYIPLGVFLRCFTPTRRIGGSLIGVGISFLFIFPLLYSLNFAMFYSQDAGPMETFSSFVSSSMNSGAFTGKVGQFYQTKYTEGVIDFVGETLGGLGRLFTTVIGDFFTLIMVLPLSTIGRAFAIGFIMPVFNILLMVQATRYISKTIGEEVDISTLTRMV